MADSDSQDTIGGNQTGTHRGTAQKSAETSLRVGWQWGFSTGFCHSSSFCVNEKIASDLWRMQRARFSGRMSTITTLWFLKWCKKSCPKPCSSSLPRNTPGRWTWTWSLVLCYTQVMRLRLLGTQVWHMWEHAWVTPVREWVWATETGLI